MGMFTVAKACEFELAHVVETHEVEGKNVEPHWHKYDLLAEVAGPVNIVDAHPDFGMVVDFGQLQSILQRHIVGALDGNTLRTGYPFPWTPTAENICHWAFLVIKNALFAEVGSHVRLLQVELAILGAGDTDVDHTGRVLGEHAEPEHWSYVTYSEETDEAAAISLRGQRARSA